MNPNATITLSVDNGPDVQVRESMRKQQIRTYCPKSGKDVGKVELYVDRTRVLCYRIDRRKPVGQIRQAWLVDNTNQGAEQLLKITGNDTSVKTALRLEGFSSNDICVDICRMEIAHADG